MSVIGLESGLYKQLHDYAELVDESLISLKKGTTPSADSNCQRLGKLLMALGSERWNEVPIHVFLFSVSNFEKSEVRELALIGQSLLSDGIEARDLKKLERLASVLERKQSKVMARMRETEL